MSADVTEAADPREQADAALRIVDKLDPMPSAVFLGREPAHSPGWHDLRRAGIGGSEVAAILGLSPWQSPFSLWHSKAAGWVDEPGPEQQWGADLEPVLLAWWKRERGGRAYGVTGGTYAHRDRAWQHANPDLVAQVDGDLVLVEAKKASSDDDWGTPGTDEVPPYYRVQVIHYLDVLGIARAEFVVTNLGRAPVFYVVEYDAEEAALIRGHAEAFWRSLALGEAPDLDGHSATYQAVRRLHPDIDDTDAEVSAELAERWQFSRVTLRHAEEHARRRTSELLAAMGNARRALTPDGTPVARRQPARGGSVALYEIGRTK